ncbi:MAG: murein L,D-transpeptidase, partial [Gemmatimonadetes bacterium]|nr:murein L,D-transpeptidase [Gemmatimonadota bacterium]
DQKEQPLTPEQLNQGRLDNSWEQVVQLAPYSGTARGRNPEKWEQISPQELNAGPVYLPLFGDVAGPSVFRVQILLDRVFMSPGMMDGRWGKNTAIALYFFQQREGLPTTARVDSATFTRLADRAGSPRQLVVPYQITAEDTKGPFTKIPTDVYEQAKLDCSCYQTLTEELSEKFHLTQDLLKQLNPGVDLDNARAGQTIQVPAVRDDGSAPAGQVSELVVSGKGSYVNAVDASGKVLYHFPSTLGAKYSPSPSGQFKITSVTQNPKWHYQPALLTGVNDTLPEAMVPGGPNNAVGKVWMALSAPHYGIHGTSSPETIGYATSHGCVRLTNWDAEFLAGKVHEGVPVHFRDIQGEANTGQDQGGTPGSGSAAAAAATDTTAHGTRGSTAAKRSGSGADSATKKSGTTGRSRSARADSTARTRTP